MPDSSATSLKQKIQEEHIPQVSFDAFQKEQFVLLDKTVFGERTAELLRENKSIANLVERLQGKKRHLMISLLWYAAKARRLTNHHHWAAGQALFAAVRSAYLRSFAHHEEWYDNTPRV